MRREIVVHGSYRRAAAVAGYLLVVRRRDVRFPVEAYGPVLVPAENQSVGHGRSLRLKHGVVPVAVADTAGIFERREREAVNFRFPFGHIETVGGRDDGFDPTAEMFPFAVEIP